MTTKEEMKLMWNYLSSVSRWKGHQKYEGVPCEWSSFDEFYSANYQRYYRAKKKWKGYKNVCKYHKRKKSYPVRKVHFVRKEKEKGYTKENTVFTSPSDQMKFSSRCRKYMLGDRVLGTRDIQNLLKKNGVKRSMTNIALSAKQNKPLFRKNRLDQWFWKGENRSLKDIEEMENIRFGFLSNKVYKNGYTIEEAVNHCKKYFRTTYLFEGKHLKAIDLVRVLAERCNVTEGAMQHRFYRYGYDLTKLTMEKSDSKYAPYRKPVIAIKSGTKTQFPSVQSACETLSIHRSCANNYLKGNLNNTNQTKGYELFFLIENNSK